MRETLHVEKFAGMEDVALRLAPLNILIGPQASGKSVCAKLLFLFKGFWQRVHRTIIEEETKRDLDARLTAKFEECFPPETWLPGAFSLTYTIGSEFIRIARGPGSRAKHKLEYSAYFKESLVHFRKEYRKSLCRDENKSEEERFEVDWDLRKQLSAGMAKKFRTVTRMNQIFMPAGRSFFANLQSSIFSFLSSNQALDPFLLEFGSFYEQLKNMTRARHYKRRINKSKLGDVFDSKLGEILHGEYFAKKRVDYLRLEDGRSIRVENASSGQQEMLPLALLLKYLPFSYQGRMGATVYIEEPEAHLFPNAQRHIVELIASVFNVAGGGIQFFITTHSPYVLTSFNNLLQAGSLAKVIPEDSLPKLHSVVPEQEVIDPKHMQSYCLQGGRCQDLRCRETGLISANAIDGVSDSLAIQFGDLLDLG